MMGLLNRAADGLEMSMEDQVILMVLLRRDLFPLPPDHLTYDQRPRRSFLGGVRRERMAREALCRPTSHRKVLANRRNIRKRWENR
jgi:hypothetical protein